MGKVEIPYVHTTVNRHGKSYHNFRKKGFPRVRLPGEPGSISFMQVYAECLDKTNVQKFELKHKIVPGSIAALVRAYYKCTSFLALSEDSSQQNYRRVLDKFCDEYGRKPVGMLEARHIKAIIASKSKTPAAANQLLKRLKQLMRFAVEEGLIKFDPTLGVNRVKYKPKPIHTWTESEAAKFVETHPPGTMAFLAFMIMSWTGLRKSDLVRLGKNHLMGDRIEIQQKKTGAMVTIPIMHQQFAAELTNVKDRMIFVVSSRGLPFTANGFGNWMRERCNEAGLPECSSHGLRKLIATRLAEEGCSENQISAILGWRTNNQASLYTRAANREKLAKMAMKAIS